MLFRKLISIRRFSTSRVLRESLLSANYKSTKLWNERFKCPLLSGDEATIKKINNKIVSGADLTTSEMDIFINIATPNPSDVTQLQESLRFLKNHRRSIAAHTVLSSTHHALCRLFLYSRRLDSLINVLENRVDFGVFSDSFAMNLLLNEAIDQENYALASRLATLVMLQEEFGLNPITDVLSVYSVCRYLESKTDFSDWTKLEPSADRILEYASSDATLNDQKKESTGKGGEDENNDEDEEEDEYVRIPFLRNEYFDNHFDLKHPRLMCGKTLSALSRIYEPKNSVIAKKCSLLGSILSGRWNEVADLCKLLKSDNFNLGPEKSIAKHYMQNLNDLTAPDDQLMQEINVELDALLDTDKIALSSSARSEFDGMRELENADIARLSQDFKDWSKQRHDSIRRNEEKKERDKLIQEVRAKKEELRQKEQYLYFFDNLKKKKLTRIDYN